MYSKASNIGDIYCQQMLSSKLLAFVSYRQLHMTLHLEVTERSPVQEHARV